MLIVTGDVLLKRGIEQRANEYSASPRIVATISEAVKAVAKEAARSYKAWLKKEAEKATDLLSQYRGEIAASVKDVKWTCPQE